MTDCCLEVSTVSAAEAAAKKVFATLPLSYRFQCTDHV